MATQKSYTKNTARPSQLALKGNVAQPPKSNRAKGKRRPKAAGYGMAREATGATGAKKKQEQHKSKRYVRNTAATETAGIVAAFVGAFIINVFDALINRVAPSTSGFYRTIGKFGVGWAVGSYGAKLPFMRGAAPIVRNSLYIAGALDVVGTYLTPHLLTLLSTVQIPTLASLTGAATTVAPAAAVVPAGSIPVGTATDPATGALGMVYQAPSGDRYHVFDQRGGGNAGGGGYNGGNNNVWGNYNAPIGRQLAYVR